MSSYARVEGRKKRLGTLCPSGSWGGLHAHPSCESCIPRYVCAERGSWFGRFSREMVAWVLVASLRIKLPHWLIAFAFPLVITQVRATVLCALTRCLRVQRYDVLPVRVGCALPQDCVCPAAGQVAQQCASVAPVPHWARGWKDGLCSCEPLVGLLCTTS